MEIPQSLIDKGITQEQLDAFLYFRDKWFWEDFWTWMGCTIVSCVCVLLLLAAYGFMSRRRRG